MTSPWRCIVVAFLLSLLLTLSQSSSVDTNSSTTYCSVHGVRFHGRGIRINADDLIADCEDDGTVVCYNSTSTGKTVVPCDKGNVEEEEEEEEERGVAAFNDTQQSQSKRCRVGDVEFGGLGHYLVGAFRLRGSVFADCVDGVAICYEDDNVADAPSKRIRCDAAELASRRRRLGVFAAAKSATWPHRVVCVHWVASFARAVKELWFQAFQEYLKKTGIHFVSRNDCRQRFGDKTPVCNNCETYVVFKTDSPRCSANVGFYTDMPHTLDVGGPGCFAYSTFLHELGHVVGLFHEHAHPQREIIVLRDRMTSVSSINYAVATRDEASTTKYERRSIMHYSESALCIPKNPKLRYCDVTETRADGCVEPKEQHCDPKQQSTFGQTSELTQKDVDAINKMYEKVPRHPNSPAPRSRSFRGTSSDADDEEFEWSDFSSQEDSM